MKLFPDAESRKRFMSRGLPFLLGIAWTPIIGLIITAIIGQPLAALIGWPVTLGITAIMTFLCTLLLLRFFKSTGHKIRADRQ